LMFNGQYIFFNVTKVNIQNVDTTKHRKQNVDLQNVDT
jgi:hypothetical protein